VHGEAGDRLLELPPTREEARVVGAEGGQLGGDGPVGDVAHGVAHGEERGQLSRETGEGGVGVRLIIRRIAIPVVVLPMGGLRGLREGHLHGDGVSVHQQRPRRRGQRRARAGCGNNIRFGIIGQ
jgi:hypothetical protein